MQYIIAGHKIEILHPVSDEALDSILPSFIPFKVNEEYEVDKTPLLTITIDHNLKGVSKEQRHHIKDVDTGNGITRVDKKDDGGYQFLISNVSGFKCGLLISNADFSECVCALRGNLAIQRFALNNIIMMSYAFRFVKKDTLLIHASVIRHAGIAYAFTAQSGTGKSTQVANWMRNIPDCDIMNDDNPILRIIDGKPHLFGSPWSGKTPCYRNISAPLGAIMLIERDDHNHVEPQRPMIAFSTLITACSSMKWDEYIYMQICSIVKKFLLTTRVATLHCLPDADSAWTCQKYVTQTVQ